MATQALASEPHQRVVDLNRQVHPFASMIFLAILGAGLIFAGYNIFNDTAHVGEPLALGAFLFLGLALLIALGFEFVNGFHDTANAVATVIYTNSMAPVAAVVWSGTWNFIGVVTSSGAVAYSIITLLPVELILNVGSASGYAMIFALLLAAVIWNLGTWWLGLPNSSSHALIGSILGVGLANQLLAAGETNGTSGVDWAQAQSVLLTLLVSPIIGFIGAMVLLWVMKKVIRNPELYKEPKRDRPPPLGIRSLLVFTCTAVSFAHGGNDGQKGMGLIMLILIGVAPPLMLSTGPCRPARPRPSSNRSMPRITSSSRMRRAQPSHRKTRQRYLPAHCAPMSPTNPKSMPRSIRFRPTSSSSCRAMVRSRTYLRPRRATCATRCTWSMARSTC